MSRPKALLLSFSDAELLGVWEALKGANAVWQALDLGARFKRLEQASEVDLRSLSSDRKSASLPRDQGVLLLTLLRRKSDNHRQLLLSLQAAQRLEEAIEKSGA